MVYELYIELRGIEPRIWRKIQVDAYVTLNDLHNIIQISMGWTNSHLYSFTTANEKFSLKEYELGPEYQDSKFPKLLEFPDDFMYYRKRY